MLSRIGKFYHFTNTDVVHKYDNVYHDMLWYLMKETQINRLVSRDSFREFLTRYFIITETDIDQAATDFIDHGILVEGIIGNNPFLFTMRDLIAFAGFCCSDFLYNINGTLDEFRESYVHSPLNPQCEEDDKGNKAINTDSLMIGFLDLITLSEVSSLSLKFRKNIAKISEDYVKRASRFAEYVVSLIPESVFDEIQTRCPWLKDVHKEYFEKSKIIKVNVFELLSRKALFEIYRHIMHEETLRTYEIADLNDPDIISDLNYYNTHILFAFGVKHGYIKRSYDVPNNHLDFDPLFDIDTDVLMGNDGEVYCTEDIYNDWSMDDWIHLLP